MLSCGIDGRFVSSILVECNEAFSLVTDPDSNNDILTVVVESKCNELEKFRTSVVLACSEISEIMKSLAMQISPAVKLEVTTDINFKLPVLLA